ncbi:hypothetical protein T484DRAFT_1943866 [Baffinella frigidus]|nr:hypothetical protein T484DRAFT_1943866 [Cryptophyta sp. CCMP2293]
MICESVRGHGCDMCIVGGSLPGLPGTLKTAIFGSVSLDVARSCSCPLVVVKTGRGVGALLKVIPRRVFLYTERSSDSDSVFDWALTKLINPETDEVYLVRDKASVTEGYPRFEEDQEDVGRKDAERASKDAHADGCIAALRAIGVRTIHRVRNVDSTPSSLLAIATSNSCDLLVTTRNAPGLFAAHNATFPVVVAAPDFETKAATQLEPPAMLQFWGGRIENPASSCDSSVTLSSTLLWEEGETTPTSDARSSHDFGDLEGERERGRTTSFERMLAGLDVSVFEGEGGTCRLSVAATAPSEGEGGGGGGGARAAQLSGGGGVSGGGMSRTNSRWNLALDNCPEEGLGMSCAEAVASVCSEWELEAAPLAFEPRLFEPSFEPVVLGMGAHEMSIQA